MMNNSYTIPISCCLSILSFLLFIFPVLYHWTDFIIYTCLLYSRESAILVIDETFFSQPFSIKHWWLTQTVLYNVVKSFMKLNWNVRNATISREFYLNICLVKWQRHEGQINFKEKACRGQPYSAQMTMAQIFQICLIYTFIEHPQFTIACMPAPTIYLAWLGWTLDSCFS